MKRVTKHIRNLAEMLVEEGLGYDTDYLLNIVNQEWEMYTDRPYTAEDCHHACGWIYRRLA